MAKSLILRTSGGLKTLGRGVLASISPSGLLSSLSDAIKVAGNSVIVSHGGLFMTDNSNAQTVTSTPSDLKDWTGAMPANRDVATNAVDGTLTIPFAGTYQVGFYGVFSATLFRTYVFQLAVNGSPVGGAAKRPTIDLLQQVAVSGSAFLELSAGDVLAIQVNVEGAGSPDVTLRDGEFIASRVV